MTNHSPPIDMKPTCQTRKPERQAGNRGSLSPGFGRRSKGGSDQLRDTVDTKDDRGEAARDYREEKGRCDGVLHRVSSRKGPHLGCGTAEGCQSVAVITSLASSSPLNP